MNFKGHQSHATSPVKNNLITFLPCHLECSLRDRREMHVKFNYSADFSKLECVKIVNTFAFASNDLLCKLFREDL